jgi:mono/diheme cytochrome c family protein
LNKLLIFFLPFLLSASEDFISHYEYGQMLYSSPRGVSCSQCHGNDGQGKVIVSYKDEDGKKVIAGSDIRQKSLATMIDAVNQYHKIMPRYYLTDEEVAAIYDYIQKKNEKYLLQFSENNSSI